MEQSQSIFISQSQHLPVTIHRLLATPGARVAKLQTPLLIYEYTAVERVADEEEEVGDQAAAGKQRLNNGDDEVDDEVDNGIYGYLDKESCSEISLKKKEKADNPPAQQYKTRRAKAELLSPYEGIFGRFSCRPGDVIQSKSHCVATVIEPCGHAVQLHGLCALCGKDLSIADFSGSDTLRAQINMTHDKLGVTVSTQEAARIENENAERLIAEKKLSLILDLDQTIIHATVDPTVGEWMKDPDNSNYPALKDVHSFILPESPIRYYIKLRPGTREFLQHIRKIYEMHIYTMGTRNYAEAVANVIDPDNSIFKERILSRDESGSFAVKSIQRLFPCNQSMVVVVDDRGDVWDWPKNLIKVIPYNFFVGIGDINEPMYAASQVVAETKDPNLQHHSTPVNPAVLNDQDRAAMIMAEAEAEALGEEKGKELILEQMSVVQDHTIAEQMNSRPLLQESLKLEGQQESDGGERGDTPIVVASSSSSPSTNDSVASTASISPTSSSSSSSSADVVLSTDIASPVPSPAILPPRPARKRPMLVDNDLELDNVTAILDNIHKEFYTQQKSGLPDAGLILYNMKRRALAGVVILFSGIIPTGFPDPSLFPDWRMAVSCGAECHMELGPRITHVVAAKRGTAKVEKAKKMRGVFIVKPEWLHHSTAQYKRMDEVSYLLESGAFARGASSSPELKAINTSKRQKTDDDFTTASPDDEVILSGNWEHKDDIFVKFGEDDWGKMNDEVEAAMMEDDSSDDGDASSSMSSSSRANKVGGKAGSSSSGEVEDEGLQKEEDDEWGADSEFMKEFERGLQGEDATPNEEPEEVVEQILSSGVKRKR